MSFAFALKEPPDAEVELEAGVAAGAAAPEPTAEADGPIDGALYAATDGAADGDGDGVGALAGETELGDPEAVPGVAADGDGDGDGAAAGTGGDGAPEAEAPFGIAAANHAVTHPWYAWNSILICDLMASVFAIDELFEAPIHEMKAVVSDWSILNRD